MKLVAVAAIAVTIAARRRRRPGAARPPQRLSRPTTSRRLSELIADELMIQQNVRGTRTAGGGIGPPEFRTIRSEVAFIALPGEVGWMGFRRVTKVGSNLVEDELGALTTGLAGGAQDDYARARAMLADSARFNLGSPRTINLPNLPLELLHARHASRFSVRIAGKEHVRGKNTTKLVFVEECRPDDHSRRRRQPDAEHRQRLHRARPGRLWRADVITRDPSQGDFAFDARDLGGVQERPEARDAGAGADARGVFCRRQSSRVGRRRSNCAASDVGRSSRRSQVR